MYTAVVDLVEALDALSDSGSSDNQDEPGEMETSVPASTVIKSPGKSFALEQYVVSYL